MINGFSEVLSKEAVLGVGLYFAGAYLAAGPISERIAVRDHLQPCVSGTIRSAAAPSQEQINAHVALGLFRQSTQALPGQFGDLLTGAIDSAAQQAALSHRKRAEDVAATAPDRCHCMIALALAETRIEWAYYVGSLKLYRAPSIARFGDVIAGADRSNICRRAL